MMKSGIMWLAAAMLSIAVAGPAWAGLADFDGAWRNVDQNTRGITRVVFSVSGTTVRVHVFASCHPQDCDWGTVTGTPYASRVTDNLAQAAHTVSAVFDAGFSETIVVAQLSGQQIKVDALTRFKDSSGRSHYTQSYNMRRDTASITEDCIGFNPQQASVQNAGGRWKVTVGNMWLLDFGSNRNDAQAALRVIRHYRLNKQCFVGRPDPSMQYYLIGNAPPTGQLQGEDCLAFNLATTQVQQVQNRWKIVDGNHWILDFGQNHPEAEQSMGIIRHYRFDHICFVGRPNPPMTYFRR